MAGTVLPSPCQAADRVPFEGAAMIRSSGLPALEATFRGSPPLTFLIDTGNTHSLLDLARAKALGVAVLPLLGPDGKPYAHYFSATLPAVRIGGADLGDLEVLVVDLQTGMAKGDLPKADGILAYTAFKDRVLRMDYLHARVALTAPLDSPFGAPARAVPLSNPTFGKEGPPIVAATGFEINGQPVTVQIDTLYAGTLLIYPTSVDKLGLQAEAASRKERRFRFTDGGVSMVEGVSMTEGFQGIVLARRAPVYFATRDVHLPDGMFDGTVGSELFEGHVLTFDFHDHVFWLD